MSTSMLRQQFFEKVVATNPDGTAFEGLKELEVNQACSGRGYLYFGAFNGDVRVVARDLSVGEFKAFDFQLGCLIHLKSSAIMVGSGTEDSREGEVIKVWNSESVQTHGEPTLLRTIQIPSDFAPVTAIAVHEGLKHIAIGFADGEVYIGTGDILRERSFAKSMKRLYSCQKCVTSLNFHPNLTHVFVYISTSHAIWGCFPDTKRIEKLTHDHAPIDGEMLVPQGATKQCAAVDQDGMLWVDGREELRGFIPEAQGKSIPFAGSKLLIQALRGYVVVVHKPLIEEADAIDGASRVYSVTICDPKNNLIVFDEAFDDVTHVLYEWSSVFIVTSNKLYQLSERDFETKMGLLFKRNRYEVAINLAKEQYRGTEGLEDILINIYIKFANYLYKRKKFDDAVHQYIKTIGKLEPSYVIRKFLDSQRIYNLTDYLQALHDCQRADKYHTTLLLNCYTKLKNAQKLDEFIMNDKDLNFDLETAIVVCRQAGYYKHALFLARKFQEHEWYLKIQLENVHNEKDALEYITRLPFEAAHVNMENYGKRLVTALPVESTKFLQKLCSEDYEPGPPFEGVVTVRRRKKRIDDLLKPPADPDNFIHLYVDQLPHLVSFLEYMVAQRNGLNPKVYDTLLELYLRETPRDDAQRRERDNKAMALLKAKQYSEHQAVILTQMYDFKEGILFLFGETKQYQQIVRYYMEKKEYAAVVKACQTYSDADPSLWVQALEFFAAEQGCQNYLRQVLDHIDAKNLLPPLMVIEVLARYDQVVLSSIKDYFTRRQKSETQSILEDEEKIKNDRKKSDAMRKEIEQLTTKATIFQDNHCSHCSKPLTLPVVHFLCGHSYHWDHIPNENECSRCRDKHAMVLNMARSHEHETHDAFNKRLDGAKDRFDVVAKLFGQNMFDKKEDSGLDNDATPRKRAPSSGRGAGFGQSQMSAGDRLDATSQMVSSTHPLGTSTTVGSKPSGVYPSSSSSPYAAKSSPSTPSTSSAPTRQSSRATGPSKPAATTGQYGSSSYGGAMMGFDHHDDDWGRSGF